MSENYHSFEALEVLKSFKSSEKGLTEEEAKNRLKKFGFNELRKERRITALEIFASQFKSFLIIILIFASIISFLLGEITDATVISSIIVLNAILGFVQEYRAEKAIEALKKLAAPKAKVMREGQEAVIQAREVVPGDILLFEAGDCIAADARLIEAMNLKVDESLLTGESVPSLKVVEALPQNIPLADRENMAYSGTIATYGRGKGVVVATGMGTEFGKIAEHIQEAQEGPTPLQLRLRSLGMMLGGLVILISALLFALEVLEGQPVLESFMLAVALAVSAVPEGLPAVVTVALALGVRKMSRRNAIVRRLASVETLGSTTVICSDKTGTLTKDEMTVKRILVNDRFFEINGTGYEPKGEFLKDGDLIDPEQEPGLSLLLKIGCLCNHASLGKRGSWSIIGDPTEGALLTLAAKAGIWRDELVEERPLIAEIPFDSLSKRMTTIHEFDGKRVAYVKGAPEILLELSSFVYKDGKATPLSKEERERTLMVVKDIAIDALRVLAFAYKEIPSGMKLSSEEIEKDLVFVGIVGMIDPPREEVRDAIAQSKRAGIRAVMITGDHELTAQAIAKDVGLLEKDGRVITGVELDKMSDEEFGREVESIVVYARTSPEHKVKVLEALKKKGHIVAMTGDGVNDAPAVKGADIGISMGIKGTDVTREASDMILADDNFATIVKAVEEGRGIYDNIRKFIRLLLSTNLDEILLVASATLLKLPLPILPIQVLWVNVISDGLPALALSFDPYEKDIMQRKPRSPKEGIFHGMLLFVLAAAVVDFLVEMLLLIYWKNTNFVSLERVRTMIFTSTVLFELFFVFNCRSENRSVFRTNIFQNKKLVLAVALSFLLHLAVIYVPFFQPLFKTVPLNASDWLIILAMSSSGLLILPEIFMR
ncbi:MAG: calcium-translocating P-type ATPase, SERCA-type [Dehalococcoidia bacterium]